MALQTNAGVGDPSIAISNATAPCVACSACLHAMRVTDLCARTSTVALVTKVRYERDSVRGVQ